MQTAKKCPMCQKPTVVKYQPFCSKRCADLDLGQWLNGTYVIEGKDYEALSDLDVDSEELYD